MIQELVSDETMHSCNKLPKLLLLACITSMAACTSDEDEGADEAGEAGESGSETDAQTDDATESIGMGVGSETAETETSGTETSGTETAGTETAETGTEDTTGPVCELALVDVGGEGQDCYILITCTDQSEHSVSCNAAGCTCFDDGVEVGGCSDSFGVCGVDEDLGVVEGCCGWQF